MINDERKTPLPFQAGQQSSESPRNAYELLKLEIAYWLQDRRGTKGASLSEDAMQYEACRIIYASEVLSEHGVASQVSWLGDLLMSSDELNIRARMEPLRGQAENCLLKLKVNGKDDIFEECPLEKQLKGFVRARTLLGLTATSEELQIEACNIVGRMEESTIMPSEEFANFLLRLILKSALWLSSFRQRAGLLPADEPLGLARQDAANVTVRSYSRLERELAEFVRDHRTTTSSDPTDEQLQKKARCIVYRCQDGWQQTAADNKAWLDSFKQRHSQNQNPQPTLTNTDSPPTGLHFNSGMSSIRNTTSPAGALDGFGLISTESAPSQRPAAPKQDQLFLNVSGCYRRLAKDLSRFVAASMSPNNPNQHVPTDKEIQHQARWILYDE